MHRKLHLFWDAVKFFKKKSSFATESLTWAVPSWRNGSARWTFHSKFVGSSPIEGGRFFNLKIFAPIYTIGLIKYQILNIFSLYDIYDLQCTKNLNYFMMQ